MDAAQALADLTEISSQIEAAVVFGATGAVEGSTLDDDGASEAFAAAAGRLLEASDAVAGSSRELTQLEVATAEGSVFVVRDGDRRIAAATGPSPTVGLVFYDLKSCLRAAAPAKPRRRKKTDGEA